MAEATTNESIARFKNDPESGVIFHLVTFSATHRDVDFHQIAFSVFQEMRGGSAGLARDAFQFIQGFVFGKIHFHNGTMETGAIYSGDSAESSL